MKRRPALLILLPLLLIAALAWFVLSRRAGDGALDLSGTVEATESELGFTVAGRLEMLAVDEGDTVGVGQELARLDRAETEARRAQAAAQAASARAVLRELERGSRDEEIAQARAALAAADDLVVDAERDLERARSLRADDLASQQALEKAETTLKVARSQRDQAREALRLVEAGPRRERIESARATLAAAEASVKAFDATLANMVVRAPFAGVVTVRNRRLGEIVPAGSPVLTVLNREDRWVRVYVPETRIGAVHVGQRAAIATDTFRDKRYEGSVATIASEAEFTPKTVQTREERVKLVYAVKVRIIGDSSHDLKPGMPADVLLEGPAK
jgi:HlyD family secretion protein